MTELIIYCDGGSRGNPGPSASAYAVYRNRKHVYKASKYIGESTNNFAEYTSVLMAMEWLKENSSKSKKAKIVVDSQLVYKQLKGEYKIKNERLKSVAIKIKNIENKIDTAVTFEWSPRSGNKIADKLVNDELDNY